jgi:hypothetical protein
MKQSPARHSYADYGACVCPERGIRKRQVAMNLLAMNLGGEIFKRRVLEEGAPRGRTNASAPT